jgi:DNA-binding beta-propeller fold protein YncE
VSGEPNGAVYVIDLTNRVISSTISVPFARRIAIDHKGSKILVFADNTNTAYVVDTTAFTATPIADPNGALDHPVNAVFSADDSKAYILSCGPECGGSQARVTAFNPSDNSLGNSVTVTGATAGILDSSGKLYIAGDAGGLGTLQTVDTSALASGNATPSTAIAIQDGYHRQMAFTDDNRLYIGSTNCTSIKGPQNTDVQGCLVTYNTSSQAVVKTAPTGDVTGILPIIGRHLAYVVQGGELVIYDTTKDAPRPDNQIDVVGQAFAILQIS